MHDLRHCSDKRTIKPVRSSACKEKISEQCSNQTSHHTGETAGKPCEIHKTVVITVGSAEDACQQTCRGSEKESRGERCRIPNMNIDQI